MVQATKAGSGKRGKGGRKLPGKGSKILEVLAKGRARPLMITVSHETERRLREILAHPKKYNGEDPDEDLTIDHWEPRWLEIIYELASRYATEEEIVAHLPYTYTMWQKFKNTPETRIRDVLTAARSDGLVFLKSAFRSKIEEGDTRAIIFGLRAQAGWREDGLGTEGPDRGENSTAISGTVDRLLSRYEARGQRA
jgi:hypothetical protein